MSEEKSKLSLGQRIKRFFRGVKAEYSKIIFPSRETLRKQTVAVIVRNLRAVNRADGCARKHDGLTVFSA